MKDRTSTYPVATGVLIVLLLPALYLVQVVIRRAPERTQWFGGELEVSLENQSPMTLAIELHEVDGESSVSLMLAGTARLRQSTYPWDEVPFEGQVRLALEPGFFSGDSSGDQRTWAASYTERLVSRDDGLGLPPIPCSGIIETEKQRSLDKAKGNLSNWTQLDLNLNLACTSAGPDLIWASGDEQTWALIGPLSLHNRPI